MKNLIILLLLTLGTANCSFLKECSEQNLMNVKFS